MTTPPTLSLGVITPHAASGPEVEWPTMTGGQVVVRVGRVPALGGSLEGPGTPPDGPEGLRALATPAALNAAAEDGLLEAVSAIGYASTTTGYVIGPRAERILLDRVAQHCGVPVAGTAAAATAALKILEIDRLALMHPPWFDNDMQVLGAAYFRKEGFDVIASKSIDLDLTPQRADAAAVATWIPSRVPDAAQALLIGGNGFRVANIINRLEVELQRPVLTANQVLLWYLLPPTSRKTSEHGTLFAR